MKSCSLKINNNELYLGNYSLAKLAQIYQTPLYVYDEAHLVKMMRLYKEYFVSNNFATSIIYASKAFLVPELLHILAREGLMIDSVSEGDLEIIKMTNFPFEKVIFHGNNKSLQELAIAIDHNIGIIIVDNYYELNLIEKLAKQKKKVIQTMFRINPGIDAHTHQYIKTALYVSKFGESIYDSRMIDQIMKFYQKSRFLKLLGFHAHIGSQIKEVEPYLLEITKMIEFTKKVSDQYHLNITHLNLGGGFGINYTEADKTLLLSDTLKQIIKKVEEVCTYLPYQLQHLYIEPGRSIVGVAGMTLYECGIVKKTYGGKNFLLINGGMTDNIRPALYQAQYTVEVANKITQPPQQLVDVVGKCCESGDVIAHDILLPLTEPGDILVVYATGAYTYSMSSNYNGYYKPAVILVGDKVKIISRRETGKDFCKLFQ